MSVQTNYLDVDLIRIDGGTQSRAHLNQETINEYADLFSSSNDILPPIKVYFDGQDYWNADGFHRLEAAKQANMKVIPAIIEQGTRRDAILFSVGANAEHGLRRTEDDKHRAVNTLLTDDEWNNWSDNQIAKKCKVSQPFVSKLRKESNEATGNVSSKEKRTYERNGKTHTMRTNNIGKSQPTQESQELDKDPNTKEMFDDKPVEQSQLSYNVISKEVDRFVVTSQEKKIADLEEKLEEANQKIIDLEHDLEKEKDQHGFTQQGYKDLILHKIQTIDAMVEEAIQLNKNVSQKDQKIETLKNELQEANQLNTSLAEREKELKEAIANNNLKIIDLNGENKRLSSNLEHFSEKSKTLEEANNKLKLCNPMKSHQLEQMLTMIQSIIENALEKGKEKREGLRLGLNHTKELLISIKQARGIEQ